jgi:uracil-DNA glycosylase family 4
MSKTEELAKLKKSYSKCKKCSELVKCRTNVVFGVGNAEGCKVVIIGEAPGANEDLKGEPFVGKSGQLLNGLLAEIGLKRPEDVYITNTILCRPPENRNPSKEELANCKDRLANHLKILDPKVVIALGNFATKYMLNTKEGITKLKGKEYLIDFNGKKITVIPMQHPAVLLYNGNSPKKRAEFLADFKIVEKILRKG